MKILFVLLSLLLLSAVAREMKIGEFMKTANSYEAEVEATDVFKSFRVIVRSKGYAFESHKVLTDDGYWLTAFRIPGKKGETREEAVAENRPVVYLQHGVLDSADTFIVNFEDQSPAFLLANAGYDVWLGNTRGNKYSRDHQWLDPDDKQDETAFWDFDFEDMSDYDVTANIDYILKTTGKQKLGVVAHSQGTTQMFIKMAEYNDWWNERVAIFACLAGVAQLNHCSSTILTTLSSQTFLINSVKRVGLYELLSSNHLQNVAIGSICMVVPQLCNFFVSLISDSDTSLNANDRISVFMSHYPAGTSLRSLDHFGQIIREKTFSKYDYGEKINMEKYGQKTPPVIDISNIKNSKTIQIIGTTDRLSTVEDNKWLTEQLGDNLIYSQSYPLGHMSFMLARDMTYFHDVMRLFKEHRWE